MEVYGYPSHSLPSLSSASPSFSFGNLVEKVRDFFGFAVSAIIGNIFSAIFTFFFALGAFIFFHSFNLFINSVFLFIKLQSIITMSLFLDLGLQKIGLTLCSLGQSLALP
ncbi:hypothetical protein CsSME_00003224 [Camellia sinensis var. sinensis]